MDWWAANAGTNRHLYIGQDVNKTMEKADLAPSTERTQLRTKIDLTRKSPTIQGNCWWPAYSVTANVGGVADSLSTMQQSTAALVPEYPWIASGKPSAPAGLRLKGDRSFAWKAAPVATKTDDVTHYGVYRFDSARDIDLEAPGALIEVVYAPEYTAQEPGVYVVTALNRVNRESDASQPVVIR